MELLLCLCCAVGQSGFAIKTINTAIGRCFVASNIGLWLGCRSGAFLCKSKSFVCESKSLMGVNECNGLRIYIYYFFSL